MIEKMLCKVVPVIQSSDELQIGDHIQIVNINDDMNGSIGIYKGGHIHIDGVFKYLMLLDHNNCHIYVLPKYIKKYIQ